MPHRHGFGDGGSGGGGGGGPVAMGGDVSGMSNAAVVVGFGTYPIDLAAPALGDAWQWDGAQWAHVQQPVIFLVPTVPSTSIVSNRSADQSPTTAGRTGVTNFGVDTGIGAGCTANDSSIFGGVDATASGVGSCVVGGNGTLASGTRSLAGGGISPTASGSGAVAFGGDAIVAGATRSAVLGGVRGTVVAGALDSVVIGGSDNAITGAQSIALAGQANSISHTSTVAHGIGAVSRSIASVAHASGQTEVAGAGNRQWQRTIVRGDTPGAAPAETVDLGFAAYGAAPTTTAFALNNDRVYSVQLALSAVRTAGAPGEGRAIVLHAFVRCTGGAVTVVSQHLVSHVGDAGCCLYYVTLLAVGGTLVVRATTGAGNTHATRWVGSVEWEEVRYA